MPPDVGDTVVMFSDEKLPKSFRLSGSIDESATERMPEPMPPAEPTICDAAGICSLPYVRFVTPQVMNACVSGLVRARRPVHRLERRRHVLRRVVRIRSAADLVRLAVRGGQTRPADSDRSCSRPSPPLAAGRSSCIAPPSLVGSPAMQPGSVFGVCGIGCVGARVHVRRVRTGHLDLYDRLERLARLGVQDPRPADTSPRRRRPARSCPSTFMSNRTAPFGRSESHRSWWTVW